VEPLDRRLAETSQFLAEKLSEKSYLTGAPKQIVWHTSPLVEFPASRIRLFG
jgi:hypothetical protein